MSKLNDILTPDMKPRQFWNSLDYDWHDINKIPYQIFYTVWSEFIDTKQCELRGDNFFRKKRPQEISNLLPF